MPNIRDLNWKDQIYFRSIFTWWSTIQSCWYFLTCADSLFPHLGNLTNPRDPTENRQNVSKEASVDLAKEQQRLMEYLFKNYDINVRPVQDPSKNLSIRVVPALRQIVDIVSKVYQMPLQRLFYIGSSTSWIEANVQIISMFANFRLLAVPTFRLTACLLILDCQQCGVLHCPFVLVIVTMNEENSA